MIEIDGSKVLSGGQIIRSSLALSTVTGIPVDMWMRTPWMGVMDGSDESHKENLAKLMLRDYEPCDVPTYHLPKLHEAARTKMTPVLAQYSA